MERFPEVRRFALSAGLRRGIKRPVRRRQSAATVLSSWLLLGSLLPAQGTKTSVKDLAEDLRKWLQEEVAYIVTPKEKEVFLNLDSDRERQRFIEAFWKQRDPTPGTPENEFKTEHYRRISYADRTFRPGGWRSDRGRVHIILGPPLTVQRHESYTKIYPVEIWSYQQAPRSGLPPNFNVVFFDKQGRGDYVLYSPRNDGPQSLLIGYQGHPEAYQDAYDILNEYSAFLALASISLIPGENTTPGLPSMASDMLLRQIDRVPRLEVKDQYAETFLKFKDIIEVEYSANYVESSSLVQIIRDGEQTFFVNYFVGLDRLSVNQYEGTYYTVIDVNGQIAAPDGQVVYQFDKSYSIRLDQGQFETVRDSGFAIYDTFPVIPGDYQFSLVLKNTVSKEFTSFEKSLSILPRPGKLMISPLLLAHDLKREGPGAAALVPFQIGQGQLICQPDGTFMRSDRLHVFFQVYGLEDDSLRSGRVQFTFTRDDKEFLTASKDIAECAAANGDVLAEFPLQDFPAADYELAVSILDAAGRPLLAVDKMFSVSPLGRVPRPQIFSKVTSGAQGALVPFIKGMQHLHRGEAEAALGLLETAHLKSPGVLDIAVGLGRACLVSGRHDRIEPLLAPFLETGEPADEVIYLLAEAKKGLGRYGEAIQLYRRVLARSGASLDVLNSLGLCHYRMGALAEARTAWERSLGINPGQPEIRKLLDSLKQR